MQKNWFANWIEQLRSKLLTHIAREALDRAIVEWHNFNVNSQSPPVGFAIYLLGPSGKVPYFGLPIMHEVVLDGDYELPLTAELQRQVDAFLPHRGPNQQVTIHGHMSRHGYRWHAARKH